MDNYKDLLQKIENAKRDKECADELIIRYMPFIKSETAKTIKRVPVEGQDDELSISMFAFYEAVMNYNRLRGNFISFASRAIRNRLIDYIRKEVRHSNNVSFDINSEEDDNRSLLDKIDIGFDTVNKRIEKTSAEEEIKHFSSDLKEFGLSLSDIADNCPKQDRTLFACQRALNFARENTYIFDILLSTKKLPITQISEGSKISKKTLERHRKYIIAILLAYTNGFEIIRGHISQINAGKEE